MDTAAVTQRLAITLAVILGIVGGPKAPAAADDGRLIDFLSSQPHAAKDSLDAMPAIDGTEPGFVEAVTALAHGKRGDAAQAAADAGYEIRDLHDGVLSFAVLMETTGNGVGPTVVVAARPLRDVIIEVPHAVLDRGTDREGAVLFMRLGARALILAGANRCAAQEASPCSGRTRVCGGGRQAYRLSDVAHNDRTLFHAAHRVLSRAWPRAVVLQPHGFKGRNGKTHVILSDGSTAKGSAKGSLAGRLRAILGAAMGTPGRVVHCQNAGDDRYGYRTLCATTNVQGRDLNGSGDVCRTSVTAASGRFLHIEQSSAVRAGFIDDRRHLDRVPESAALLDALSRTLPCIKAGCRDR